MVITYDKFKNFQNKWVALNEDTQEVVASGENIDEVQQEAAGKATNGAHIVLKFIYPFNSYLAPSSR